MGESRINTFTYAEVIRYCGPFVGTELGNLIAWFYGYFPYSFYNLNCTLLNIANNGLYTYGQFFLYPFVAFFKLAKLFGIDYEALNFSTRVIGNTAATVATGYYEFFADFGYFFPIGVLWLLFITKRFENKDNLFNLACYSYMCCVWILMSFVNVFTIGIAIYFFVFMYFINKYFVVGHEIILSANIMRKVSHWPEKFRA